MLPCSFRVRAAISQLTGMGFTWEQANAAAQACQGNFEASLQLLLDGESNHAVLKDCCSRAVPVIVAMLIGVSEQPGLTVIACSLSHLQESAKRAMLLSQLSVHQYISTHKHGPEACT